MGITFPEERLEPLLYTLEATVHGRYRHDSRMRDVDVLEALRQVQWSLKVSGSIPQGSVARALREILDAWPAGE